MNDHASAASPASVVDEQVAAYNRRDVDAFVDSYAPDVDIFSLGVEAPVIVGADALRQQYETFFERSPGLHCQVLARIVHSNFVIDHERVTGLPDGTEREAVAIYEVRENRIRRVWFPN